MKSTSKGRSLAFIVSVTACLNTQAVPQHRHIFPPYLTIEMFLAEYGGSPHPSVPGAGSQYVFQHAHGYLDGLKDVSHGRNWCVPRDRREDAADLEAIAGLSDSLQMQSSTARPPSYAARALVEQYAAKSPLSGECATASRLTGDQFLSLITTQKLAPNGDLTPRIEHQNNQQRYAEGYLAGVIDATQGSSWCAPNRLKPLEVESSVLTEMDKRKTLGPLPENAALLLLTMYKAKFPCHPP